VSRSHARFESLEGAILLGEASDAEREEYTEHARTCSLCCGEPATGELLQTVAAARDGESWRPSIDRPVLARIREERTQRSRFAVGLLGWAAACSIAINVAFVTGFAGRVARVVDFDAAPPATASVPFGVRLPPQTFARVKRRALATPAVPVVAVHRAQPKRHADLGIVLGLGSHAVRRTLDAPADIFAGLDLRGSAQARSVAVETAACDGLCKDRAAALVP
jgi:hypothetical protein